MNHTDYCIEHQQQVAAAQAAYDLEWPHHCHACHGAGFLEYRYDPSPSGVGLGSGWMIETEPCSKCTEEGKCPRCGEEMYTEEADFCYSCMWEYEYSQPRPADHECYCWDKYEDAFEGITYRDYRDLYLGDAHE